MHNTHNKSIKEILDGSTVVPSVPTVLAQSLNLMEDPNSNIKQIADLISKDISLSAQVLKLVNSAYYGFPSQITTINKAMALLGFNTIKNLILSVSVKAIMMSNSGKPLWEHSVRCAVACQMLSKSLGGIDPDEAYIMGLLHDIGKTVMDSVNKDAVKEITRLTSLGADILQAEKMFFGYTHTDLGRELALKWKLPAVVGTAIRFHHMPLIADNKLHAGIVYVGDRITRVPIKYPILDPDIVDSFDFEVPDPMALREKVFEASEHIITALS
jgi:putative nucleotidyltransferase with HDIG domain